MIKKTCILVSAVLIIMSLNVTWAFASGRPVFVPVHNEEELESLNNSSSSSNIYVVSGCVKVMKTVSLTSDKVFGFGQDPLADHGTIIIEDGGKLVLDMKNMEINPNGQEPFIVVRKGGKLSIKSGTVRAPLIYDYKYAGIIVEEGGLCEVGDDAFLDKGERPVEAVISGKFSGGGSPDTETPDYEEDNENEHEYKEIYYGEVVKVDKNKNMTIYFTMPVISKDVQSLKVQSFDGEKWVDRVSYEQDEHMPDGFFRYSPDNIKEYLSWNHRNGKQSFLSFPEVWTEETADKNVNYRIIYYYQNFTETSEPVSVHIPRTSEPMPFTTEHDYDDLDGNRGGVGHGKSERVPVKPDEEEKTQVGPEVKPQETADGKAEEPQKAAENPVEIYSEEEKKQTLNSGENIDSVQNTGGEIKGIVHATMATLCLAAGAYAVTVILKKRKHK